MKRFILIALLPAFIGLISCNSQSAKNGNDETSEEDLFPVINFHEAGFFQNCKGINDKGASLILELEILNNTDSKINQFDLRYYMKAEFKDGTFKYYPFAVFGEYTDDDFEKFNDIFNTQHYSMPRDEVWLPKTSKVIKLIIFGYYGPVSTKYNINDEYFKRTPENLFITYKYKAISVDAEYENYGFYDVLPLWKEYQEKIGLR